MAYFMRLQHLPMKAQTTDIREFFKDFEIPGGGIHIIGGKDDEAHINFATEADLLQALLLDKQLLCGTPVTLLLALEKDKKAIVLELQKSLSNELQIGKPLQSETLSDVPHRQNGNKRKSPDCKVPERDYTGDNTTSKHEDILMKEGNRPAKDPNVSHVDVSENTEKREVHKDHAMDRWDDAKESIISPKKKDEWEEPIVLYSSSSDSSSSEGSSEAERKKRERSRSKERDRKHRKECKEKHDKNKSKERDRKHNEKRYRSRSKERDRKQRDGKSEKRRSSSKERDTKKRDGSKAKRDRSRSRESDRKHTDSEKEKSKRSRSKERDRQGNDGKHRESSKSERSRSRERDKKQRDAHKVKRDRSKSKEKDKDKKQEKTKRSKSTDRENPSVIGGSLEKDREKGNDGEKQLGHVIVSKLPHTVTEADLREYFGNFQVSDRDIAVLKSNDNPNTLMAGVKFMTMSDAMRAEEMTTPLHGQEIDVRFVSERMFNKTLQSAASSGGQPVQRNALQQTPDPASYWEKYQQQLPPGMWPWYYPPPGMPYPPGYPRLPGPPPVGPHGAGPFYPFPPNIPNNTTPPPRSIPQLPPFPGYQQKMDTTEDLSKTDVIKSSKSTVSNVSVFHVQGMKNMTAVQGALRGADKVMPAKSTESSNGGKQEFHICIHNLKNHMCANVLWSILKSLGAPCKVVRLVRSSNGAVLYAYATCIERFAIDEISKSTTLTCFDVSKEDMETNLRTLSSMCTVTEAHDADQELPITNLREKSLGGKEPPTKQATKTGVSDAETKGRLITAVSASEKKGHLNTAPASHALKHEDTAIRGQVQTTGCLKIDGVAPDMSANRLHAQLSKVGAKPKYIIVPIQRATKVNAGYAFAAFDNLSQDQIKNCKKVCQSATVKLITCSQMENELQKFGADYRLSESTGTRWESTLTSKTSESQDSRSHSKADDKRSSSHAEDKTRKTKR